MFLKDKDRERNHERREKEVENAAIPEKPLKHVKETLHSKLDCEV